MTILVAIVGVLVSGLTAGPAQAEDGNILRSFRAQVPDCSVSTGIAFDGSSLVLSCLYSPTLWAVSPEDGHLVATYGSTNVGQGLGALAFDRRRQVYWACTYPGESVVQVTLDPASSQYTTAPAFTPDGGCMDGLAYDGTDDSLFTSGDVAGQIYHYSATGEQLSVRDISGKLGACGSSGLAVGGQWLFMANNGCSQIYRAEKNTGDNPTLFGSYPERLEDMECDDVTFRSTGKAVIWSKDAYDPVLNAFELNPGDCGFGGQPAGNLDIDPGYQQRYVGGTATVTVNTIMSFMSTIRAEVLSGPNKGLPHSFECVALCTGITAKTYNYRGATSAGAGVDTLRVWDDNDNNGQLDTGEANSYVFVKWNDAINAVGMGDSFSAGEGVDPYDSGTDDDWGGNRNQCHRSAHAYSRLMTPVGYATPLAEVAKAGPPTTFDFIACSGARTYNVKTKQHGGHPQYDEGATQVDQGKAGGATDLVVLSIGGNDVGFSTLVTTCAMKDCNDPNTLVHGQQVKDWGEAQLAALPAKLAVTLGDVKAVAPNATIVLLGYPHLFPASPEEQGCASLSAWGGEMDWFNQSGDKLDETMRTAAARAGVHYVSQVAAWAGHEICGNRGSWLNGVTAPNPFDLFHKTWVGTGSFHPNQAGQSDGYAATLNAFLRQASESMTTGATGLPLNPTATTALMAAAAAPAPNGELGTLAVGAAEGDSLSGCLPDNLVRAGATVRVGGEGFAPGATVSIAFDTATNDASAPPVLGTLTADANGAVQGTVTIPANAQIDTTALLRANGAGGTEFGPNELVAQVGIAKPCEGTTYAFTGFFSPVNNAPAVNTMQAGRAVPIKFSLGGDHGLEILASGSPSSRAVDCSNQAVTDEVEQTLTAGTSSLTYDAATQRYQYIWKTDKAWAGTCRQFTLTLNDGTNHSAVFAFRP